MKPIHIYHTNDIHSHLESWPRTREYLQQQRKYHDAHNEDCLIFDLGDFIDRSDLYTEATLGRENMHLLEQAGYDAVTIGNNEGITLSKEALEALYEDVDFDVILSNLKHLNFEQPKWANKYKIYEMKNNIKVGVIAATAPFVDYYRPLGWEVINPIENLQEMAEELAAKVDILICLSHLGLKSDELLANTIPNLDLIIGAHTHHILPLGKKVNGSLLTGGGKFGVYIGHSTIVYNLEKRHVNSLSTELITLKKLPHVEGETREIESLENWGREHLDVEVFKASKYFNKEWFHNSNLAKLFSKALLDYSKADCTFFSAGIFMKPLSAGSVSAYDLHQMLPHPINVCVLKMTGRQLMDCLVRIEEHPEWTNLEVKGLGFRGEVIGKMLQYDCEIKSGSLYVKGQLKTVDDVIEVATLDMFTFGWFFPEMKDMEKKYLLPHFLRDILAVYGYKFFGK